MSLTPDLIGLGLLCVRFAPGVPLRLDLCPNGRIRVPHN